MARSPFGDYGTVDLASVYYNSTGAGSGTVPGGTTPGGTTPGGTTPGAVTDPGRVTADGSGPGVNPQGPGGSFSASSPQGQALNNPTQPYIGTSTSGGIAFTPQEARAWWDQWFAHPVNLLGVPPELLPGSLVLSPAELQRAQQLQMDGTLPVPQGVYNPLNLQIDPGSGGAAYGTTGGFGGYGSAQNALSSALDGPLTGSGTPAETQYKNTVAQVGGQTANYYPGQTAAPATPAPDYAALAATDRRYAANIRATDPTKADMYIARAVEYESRAAQPASTPAAAPQSAPVTQPVTQPAGKTANPMAGAPVSNASASVGSNGSAAITQPAQQTTAPVTQQASPATITQPQYPAGAVPVYISGVRHMQTVDGKMLD